MQFLKYVYWAPGDIVDASDIYTHSFPVYPVYSPERYCICWKCVGHVCFWFNTKHHFFFKENGPKEVKQNILSNDSCLSSLMTFVDNNHEIAIIAGTMASLATSVSQLNCQYWLKQRGCQWITAYQIFLSRIGENYGPSAQYIHKIVQSSLYN